MEEAKDFVEGLSEETGRSLGETFRLFNANTDWQSVLVSGLTKLIVSILILIIFWVAYLALSRGLKALLQRFKATRERNFERPVKLGLRYTVLVLAFLALTIQYGIPPQFTSAIARTAIIVFSFYIGWLVVNRVFASYLSKRGLDPSLIQLFVNISSVVIITFAFTTVLAQFGINVFSIITALGVVGIAVGFAAQETLSNFIAGITLLVERPFRIGDWINTHDRIGKVQAINLRTTRLMTRDNEVVVIPNATVTSSDIINFTAGGPLRIRCGIGIAYKENIKRARDLLLPLLTEQDLILKSPAPSVRVKELADSSVNLEMVYWIAPATIDKEPSLTYALLEEAKITLDDAGIEIPFPHLQLFVDEAKGLERLFLKP
ncbi:MAG: mechanosensitive ion channel family protein [Trueperaceae bacterium]|nr:mechanosensitive ion channel family protein [Trueperaceae bacterium]